jgi:hypothetical protein
MPRWSSDVRPVPRPDAGRATGPQVLCSCGRATPLRELAAQPALVCGACRAVLLDQRARTRR